MAGPGRELSGKSLRPRCRAHTLAPHTVLGPEGLCPLLCLHLPTLACPPCRVVTLERGLRALRMREPKSPCPTGTPGSQGVEEQLFGSPPCLRVVPMPSGGQLHPWGTLPRMCPGHVLGKMLGWGPPFGGQLLCPVTRQGADRPFCRSASLPLVPRDYPRLRGQDVVAWRPLLDGGSSAAPRRVPWRGVSVRWPHSLSD